MSKKIKLNKEILIYKYLNENKTLKQIAKELSCSKTTIIRYFRRYNISSRTSGEARIGLFKGNNNPAFKYDISKKQLIKEYILDRNSLSILAKKYNTYKTTIRRILKRFNIKCRSNSESQKGLRPGPANPNWIDGRSFLPYPAKFNKALKAKIRKRDNYTCQVCKMTEEEHLIVYGCNLTVHHVDYNKENCKDFNLVSTCFGCNARVNFNRGYWTSFFKNKIGTKNGRI